MNFNKALVKTVEGIYENGIIKPLEPLSLKDASKILITIFKNEGATEKPELELLSREELLEKQSFSEIAFPNWS